MQNRVAVGTYRLQILDRIHDVIASDLRQWSKMVDVDIPVSLWTIYCAEAEPTDAAIGTVSGDAVVAGIYVALVAIYQHAGDSALRICCRLRHLVGKADNYSRELSSTVLASVRQSPNAITTLLIVFKMPVMH